MTINKTIKKGSKVREAAHENHMGGRSWDLSDPVMRLEIAAASCFFGEPTYYGTPRAGRSPAEATKRVRSTLDAEMPESWLELDVATLLERTIDEALDKDPEATLKLAVRLRTQAHMRMTPQVIFVRAAHHAKVRGTGILKQYAEGVMRRLDEPAAQFAYHLATYGKVAPIPNALKKCWKAMLEGATEYGLAKYRLESREVKLVDVVNLCHPKSAVVDMLVKGTLKTTDITWESIVSAKGSTKEAWTESVDVMGHMAILRNLRNLHENGVDQSLYLDKLVRTAPEGQQLPFRYWSAYQATKAAGVPAKVLDAIETCMMESIGRLPTFSGRVMSLCDNSGSAQRTTTSSLGSVKISHIANLTAIMTAMTSDDGWIGVFGDRLQTMQVRKKSSLFDVLEKATEAASSIGEGTENGVWLFFDKAIKTKEHWDHIFVYSDMQAGHGGLYGTPGWASGSREYVWNNFGGNDHIDVAKLVQTYRSQVNPNVNVYLVQVAGYHDTLVPEFYDRTYILGGWSESVIRFAAEMAALRNGQKVATAQD